MIGYDNKTDEIYTLDVPSCYMCGSRGIPLYTEMTDRLFGAPGFWTLKRCPDPSCGLVWMDPMPTKSEVWKAYRTYYTHRMGENMGGHSNDRLSRLILKIIKPIFKIYMAASGLRKLEKSWRYQREYAYLQDPLPEGRLLDVGCGNGDMLDRLRQQGWYVEGTDVDPEAVINAHEKHGLTVHQGLLEELQFPTGSFDAVTLNHVIEHVHNPCELLGECLRVLKHHGRLVLITPNIDGLGHQKFGKSWLPLDPPRHLHLFTENTLRKCATKSGFQSIETRSTAAHAQGVFEGSIEIEDCMNGFKRRKWLLRTKIAILKVREYRKILKGEGVGEEIVLTGRKKI